MKKNLIIVEAQSLPFLFERSCSDPFQRCLHIILDWVYCFIIIFTINFWRSFKIVPHFCSFNWKTTKSTACPYLIDAPYTSIELRHWTGAANNFLAHARLTFFPLINSCLLLWLKQRNLIFKVLVSVPNEYSWAWEQIVKPPIFYTCVTFTHV